MQITEVKSKREKKDFLQVPRELYKDDPNWICHLDNDIEAIFDPAKNKYFDFGIAARWVLYDGEKKLIGRVAAFINRHLAYTYEHPTGGMGFFECINSQEAANQLLDTAKEWLEQRGMEAMDGPINFGEKDRFWGLLTEGFETPPPYLLNYNPPWYKELFETYGFQNYYEQYVYGLSSYTEVPPLVHRNYDRLTKTHGYSFINLKMNQLERFADDFMQIYNHAWKDVHKHFKPMTREQALNTFKSMKAVVDEDLVVFAYHNERPIAVFIGIPELNQLFKYVDGKLNLTGKLKFLYHKLRGKCNTIYGIVFGVIPEYRNKGVESGLILNIQKSVLKTKKYENMYIAWIGDFNPKMIRIVEILTKNKVFTLVTYRKMFKKEHVFSRHPVLD
ncbi:MAG: hypothetical protein EA361_04460 [Bacteroidetes bacterium]|nr:MAG: hypothetical protein EA361_04460 [Bacteroidota bacterium]